MKYIRISICFLFIVSIITCSTDKKNSSAYSLGIISAVDSLQASGGDVVIPIQWNSEKWEIEIDSALPGSSPFILQVHYSDSGNIAQSGQTNVIFSLSKNTTHFSRSQFVTLKSLTKGTSVKYAFTQTPAFGIHTKETVIINPSIKHQTIRGFGGTNLNNDWKSYLTRKEIDLAFGQEDGLQLSIMRLKIPYDEEEWKDLVPSAQYAARYNILIMATPWSPPLELKNNHYKAGGSIAPENYKAYAQWLIKFIDYMADRGVKIDAISLQNEPDYKVDYESCDWTPAEELAFVKECGAMIQAKAKLICAESFNFRQSYGFVLMNDKEACPLFDIVGGHIYGSGIAINSRAQENNKEVWVTEYLLNDAWRENCNITPWEESLIMAQSINQCMQVNWNAYIYWYIKRYYSFIGDGEQGTQENTILARGYVMSHFSKFIRPGDVRIESTSALSLVETSAYENDHQYTVILINPSSASFGVQIQLKANHSQVEAYVTTEKQYRTAIPTESVKNAVKLRLPAQSISTVVIKK